jgi:hypothetical protein
MGSEGELPSYLNVIKDESIDISDLTLTNKQNMSKSQIHQKFQSFLANKKKKTPADPLNDLIS